MSSTVTLILGGVRSGKSDRAEQLAARSGRQVVYLATAVAGDAEMAERIAAHRARRPSTWRTIEAPDDLAAVVREQVPPGQVVLVDCLTLWVSNAILRRLADLTGGADVEAVSPAAWPEIEAQIVAAAEELVQTASTVGVSLVLVSNEVGMGLVPPYPLGRRYRDVLGRVNRAVARRADSVVLMIAGLPVDLRRLVADVDDPSKVD